MLELGKKLTDAANGKYGLGFQYSRLGFGDSAGKMWGSSSPTAPRDRCKQPERHQPPEAIAAFDYVKRVWDSGAVPAAATTWDGNANNQYFIQATSRRQQLQQHPGKLGADTAFGRTT